jgi:Carboxypeptidase regulatory-like domain
MGRSGARWVRVFLTLAVALIVSVTGLALPAQAAGVGSVSGHVDVGVAGNSATAGQVSVSYRTATSTYTPSGVTTDAQGNFTISNLPVGRYQFQFQVANDSAGAYQVVAAPVISVTTAPTTPFSVLLRQYVLVSGHVDVDGALDQNPVAATAGQIQVVLDADTSIVQTTDASGDFTFRVFAGTVFTVDYSSGTGCSGFCDYPRSYLGGADNYADAQRLTAAGPAMTLPTMTMKRGNPVSGTVTSDAGVPLAGISVFAQVSDASNVTIATQYATTAADGSYLESGLPDGRLTVTFSDPTGAGRVSQSYPDTNPLRAEQYLTIAGALPLTNINATLHLPGSIYGTITVPGATSSSVEADDLTAWLELQDPVTQVWSTTRVAVEATVSNSAFVYNLPNLAPDTYRVRFDYIAADVVGSTLSPPFVLGAGANYVLNSTVTITNRSATHVSIQSLTSSPTGVSISGWAVWPNSPAVSVGMAVNIGSAWYGVSANQPSPDAADMFNDIGPNHGFSATIPLAPGTYSACIWVTEPTGPAVNTGCRPFVVPLPHAAITGIDAISGSAAGVAVSGYAVWPGSVGTSVTVAVNIGSTWQGLSANLPSPEGAAAVPGAGPNHGFAGTVPEAPGTYSACVWVLQPAGPATNIGCQTVVVSPPEPTAVWAALMSVVTGGISVYGNATEPDALNVHVTVAVNIGSQWYGFAADQQTGDPYAAPWEMPGHFFSGTIPLPPGTYKPCMWFSQPTGGATIYSCQYLTVPAPARAVVQSDSVTGGVGTVSVAGWDVFPDSLSTQVGMAINIGSNWYPLAANTPNPESASAYPSSVDHGYAGSVSLPPGTYSVCIWTLEPSGPAVNAGCHTVSVVGAPPAVASFTSATAVAGGIQVGGYSEFPGSLGTSVGVAAQVGSNWYGFTANGANDVAAGHGFSGVIPAAHGTYSVCMWTVEPSGPAASFGCKTVTVP